MENKKETEWLKETKQWFEDLDEYNKGVIALVEHYERNLDIGKMEDIEKLKKCVDAKRKEITKIKRQLDKLSAQRGQKIKNEL